MIAEVRKKDKAWWTAAQACCVHAMLMSVEGMKIHPALGSGDVDAALNGRRSYLTVHCRYPGAVSLRSEAEQAINTLKPLRNLIDVVVNDSSVKRGNPTLASTE